MSRAEIKGGMSALLLNEPLRLAHKSPSFKPPVMSTEATFESTDQLTPQDGITTQDQKRIPMLPRKDEKLGLTVEKLKAGYTRIPNSILMEIILGDLSKAEIKLLLLIARLTVGFKEKETGKKDITVG